jgi:undecaprenyl diphosphate synthase
MLNATFLASPETRRMTALPATTPPRHVAIILDGNGRWAQARGLPRVAGHKKGADRVREVVRAAGEAGIEVLTVFALSLDNKKRPADEVKALYALLERFAVTERKELIDQRARVQVVGDVESLPPSCQAAIRGLEEATSHGDRMVFRLAVAYGAREDLVRAAQRLAMRAAAGELDPASITEQTLRDAMWTAGAPSPDLLIRTGGDHRISDFMLLECAYSELYFTETQWPDFGGAELHAALREYAKRERRFGLVGDQVKLQAVGSLPTPANCTGRREERKSSTLPFQFIKLPGFRASC